MSTEDNATKILIDNMNETMIRNFQELYSKIDEIANKENKTQRDIAIFEERLQTHIENEKSSLEKQGQRIGDIEKNPSLQRSDNWKWLLGGLGAIYVIMQVFDKIRMYLIK